VVDQLSLLHVAQGVGEDALGRADGVGYNVGVSAVTRGDASWQDRRSWWCALSDS
jgi:hypothetical protein